jgi:predicted ABC-type ATPase
VALRTPPSLQTLLNLTAAGKRPRAIILAGHNGSGKSTFWYRGLAEEMQIPLINADRLMLSVLPPPLADHTLRPWAIRLRDDDVQWQKLTQEGVRLFLELAMKRRIPFAFETVFSYLQEQPDGAFQSKADLIRSLQEHGYYVILLFVGLAIPELSIARVATRRLQGGHDVPEPKLRSRFPRTQQAIRIASQIADLTLMFDNSRKIEQAFALVRAQQTTEVLYDCRDASFEQDPELVRIATMWLAKVAPQPPVS